VREKGGPSGNESRAVEVPFVTLFELDPPGTRDACPTIGSTPIEALWGSRPGCRVDGMPAAFTGRAVSNDVGISGCRREGLFRAQSSFEGALTGNNAVSIGMTVSGRRLSERMPAGQLGE